MTGFPDTYKEKVTVNVNQWHGSVTAVKSPAVKNCALMEKWRIPACPSEINNLWAAELRECGMRSAESTETVISKTDPLIENPPSLLFQTPVITDPHAFVLPGYETYQIIICNSVRCI